MDAPDISLRAADLLAGPRGRRLLLEFGCDVADNALGSAVHEVSADLDPQRDRIARYVRYTDDPGDTANASAPATPDTVARLLTVAAGRIPLPDPADRWTVAWGGGRRPVPRNDGGEEDLEPPRLVHPHQGERTARLGFPGSSQMRV